MYADFHQICGKDSSLELYYLILFDTIPTNHELLSSLFIVLKIEVI